MTDMLIGAADLYTARDVRPWMQSARETGFVGDIYLICYRIDDSVREEAKKWNVHLYEVNHDPYGYAIVHNQRGSPTQAHNLRFYHAWEILTRLEPDEYDAVAMTDVRDVLFQRNPSDFMLVLADGGLIAPSEHIMYRNEPWNEENLKKGFGKLLWELEGHNWKAYNVGTIAGHWADMRAACQTIFRMTEGRYYPSDQSSFNVMLRTMPESGIIWADEHYGWAAQMGTTNDPTKSNLWENCCELRPRIENGIVINSEDVPFTIVHQWDRVPELKELVTKKYYL